MSDEKELTHIDLFSGIGGFTLAAEWAGFKTIVFCEKEEFCQKVLKKRFGAVIANSTSTGCQARRGNEMGKRATRKIWKITSCIPIIPEIRDFDGTKWRGATLLTGGFPCQPFSVAGQRRGKEDDRYLWPEMLRVINEAKPHWILAENVPGIFRMALDTVLADLEGEGYATGTFIIPACGLNAPHRRNRIWIVANSIGREVGGQTKRTSIRTENKGRRDTTNRMPPICPREEIPFSAELRQADSDASNSDPRRIRRYESKSIEERSTTCSSYEQPTSNAKSRLSGKQAKQKRGEDFSRRNQTDRHSDSLNAQESRKQPNNEKSFGLYDRKESAWQENWYEVAARFCRVDDGVSDRIHRLKALGNAIVPQIAFEIMKNIAWIEKEK